MVGTTKSLGAKHTLDKFYTKPELACKLLKLLGVQNYGAVIEPSAGGGHLVNGYRGYLHLI